MRRTTIAQKVLSLLSDGIPRFENEILRALNLDHSQVSLTLLYQSGYVARSQEYFMIKHGRNKIKSYAYTCLKNSGKSLSWEYNGEKFIANFVSRKRKENKTVKHAIIEALENSDFALFADEIWLEVRKILGKPINIRSLKNQLTKLYRSGKLSRLDKTKGWKFAKGYLYGLNQDQIRKRLALTQGPLSVYSEVEMGIIKNVEGAVKRISDVRNELGFDKSLITWLSRKLGRESEFIVNSKGKGENYGVELVKSEKEKFEGKGLIPWLKWLKVGGELIFYDDRLPLNEIKERITKIAYWLTEEGERRRKIGIDWENFCAKLFSLLDKNHEWQLRVIEHKERWRGQSGKEFDHVYVCTLGPREFGIRVYLIIESKAGILTTRDVDEYWRKLINEPSFRNYEDGGIKTNVIPIIMIGKTAESAALEKCRRRGIRVVFRTTTQDVYLRLQNN